MADKHEEDKERKGPVVKQTDVYEGKDTTIAAEEARKATARGYGMGVEKDEVKNAPKAAENLIYKDQSDAEKKEAEATKKRLETKKETDSKLAADAGPVKYDNHAAAIDATDIAYRVAKTGVSKDDVSEDEPVRYDALGRQILADGSFVQNKEGKLVREYTWVKQDADGKIIEEAP